MKLTKILRGVQTLSYLATAFAALAAVATLTANAATTITWPAENVGGSEAEPWDFYNSSYWGGKTPSTSYHLNFNVSELTYLTNSAAFSTSSPVADCIQPISGDFVFLGDICCHVFGNMNTSAPDTKVSVVKKGDWTLKYSLWLARHENTKMAFTNETGSITVYGGTVKNMAVNIGQGSNSTTTVRSLAGDWTINGPEMVIGQGNGSSVSIVKDAGDWCVSTNILMGYGSNSTTEFHNRGGNLVVANNLHVQSSGSGEFYMEGGHVTVSNMVRFADNWHSSATKANVYLNGGVFEAKAFRYNNGSANGYVVLNGGTYRAMSDGSVAVDEGKVGALANLHFKVGYRGGTIDTAGYDVIFPLRLLKDGSSTGGLLVKGGGSLTLENANVTYEGKTSIEPGTTLVVSNSTVKTNILSHGLVVAGVPTAGQTIFTHSAEMTASDLVNVSCPLAPETVFAIGGDGNKSIVVQSVAGTLPGNRWTGAAGDNNLSTAGNWSDNTVPKSGNAYIYSADDVTLAQGGDFAPDSITFLPGSPVTITGNGLTVNVITNLSSFAPTFECPVAFAVNYRVHCEGSAVNFAGGATATYPDPNMTDNAASHTLMGDITFTADWSEGKVAYPYTVTSGSVLHGEDARGTDPTATSGTNDKGDFLSILAGGKAYFKTVYVSNHQSHINTDGELHVEGVLSVGGDGANYTHATHDQNDSGVIYAGGIHKDNGNRTYIKVSEMHIGGYGFGANIKDYQIFFANVPVTICAEDDFEIFGPSRSNNLSDWGLNLGYPVTFNTQGHTITWTAGADGNATGALIKDGEGTLVFNPHGTALKGAVTVNGGTLKVKSASGVSSGAVTNKFGATLEVAAGATLGSSTVTLEAGSTFALTATNSTFTAIGNAVTLPTGEDEVVTIRIDGVRLRGGDHVIASNVVAGATANIALDPASAALTERESTLRVEDGKLILNIRPDGMTLIVF